MVSLKLYCIQVYGCIFAVGYCRQFIWLYKNQSLNSLKFLLSSSFRLKRLVTKDRILRIVNLFPLCLTLSSIFQQFQSAVPESGMMPGNNEPASPEGDDPSGRKKKQKKKMQKVNPSLLGFSCNPDPGLLNRGEIQSAMDAWNLK